MEKEKELLEQLSIIAGSLSDISETLMGIWNSMPGNSER